MDWPPHQASSPPLSITQSPQPIWPNYPSSLQAPPSLHLLPTHCPRHFIPSVYAFPHVVPSAWNDLLLHRQNNSRSFLKRTSNGLSRKSSLSSAQQLVSGCASVPPPPLLSRTLSSWPSSGTMIWPLCGPICLAHHGQHCRRNGALLGASGTSQSSRKRHHCHPCSHSSSVFLRAPTQATASFPHQLRLPPPFGFGFRVLCSHPLQS